MTNKRITVVGSTNTDMTFANKAASISVTRIGAQASAPYRNELI